MVTPEYYRGATKTEAWRRLVRWALGAGLLALIVAGDQVVKWRLRVVAAPGVAARRAAVIAEIAGLSKAVNAFKADTGRYPTENDGLEALEINPGGDVAATWNGPYILKVPVDKWGYSYNYQFPSKSHPAEFDLISPGADHQWGTEDDINRWTR